MAAILLGEFLLIGATVLSKITPTQTRVRGGTAFNFAR
jgi:hypothetical protein